MPCIMYLKSISKFDKKKTTITTHNIHVKEVINGR